MSELTPQQAAKIAKNVYNLRDQPLQTYLDRGGLLGCEGLFDPLGAFDFLGSSGGLLLAKQLSGFGYVAYGMGEERKDELLIATRGTKTGYDWLSNLNIGLQTGPGGFLVHAGFHEVWKSFAFVISTLTSLQRFSTIHCVGHSLGGALATLNADYLSARGIAVKLYTFGSPRVGNLYFSRSLTKRVHAENMYRVYHVSDPVPMIPPFPFFHVPSDDQGYRITKGPSGLVNLEAHYMDESYIPGVGNLGWGALGRAGVAGENDVAPQSWLEQVGANGNGVLARSAWALGMIGKALTWLLAQIGRLLVGALGLSVAANMTVLDRLAWLLSEGAALSLQLSRYIGALMAAIFRFMGRKIVAGTSLTANFIRWVLSLLYDTVAGVARRALDALP